MNDQKILSIILPCYNEENAILLVLENIFKFENTILSQTPIEEIEIIVIDDKSTDNSRAILAKLEGEIKVITAHAKIGYGGALKLGFASAKGDLIAFFDVDCTYNASDLVPMIKNLYADDLDLISGDRLSRMNKMPITRKIGNILFIQTINLLFGRKVFDAASGLKVFRSLYREDFIRILPDDLSFALAMTLFFLSHKLPFKEIPIIYSKRVGNSKLSLIKDGIRFLLVILSFWLKQPRIKGLAYQNAQKSNYA